MIPMADGSATSSGSLDGDGGARNLRVSRGWSVRVTDLEEVVSATAPRLTERLLEAPDWGTRFSMLDAWIATRVTAAGATIDYQPAAMDYGLREHGARDLEGNPWYFATRLHSEAKSNAPAMSAARGSASGSRRRSSSGA